MNAPREPRPVADTTADSEAAACRRMWSAAVLAFYGDWWTIVERAKGDPAIIARVRADAYRWASTRWGRHVLTMAGVDNADPHRVAATAVDLTARERTFRIESMSGRVGSPTGPHAGSVPSDAPHKPRRLIDLDDVRRLAAQGLTQAAIGKELGFSRKTVSGAMKRLGRGA